MQERKKKRNRPRREVFVFAELFSELSSKLQWILRRSVSGAFLSGDGRRTDGADGSDGIGQRSILGRWMHRQGTWVKRKVRRLLIHRTWATGHRDLGT
ncbi:hypothetical protein ERO13_A05G293000v2 [Gossypium hirsutum]|nr:hypothetical protein ERO13_A05G293000v2 [Gossypium hirsutum]